MIIIPGMKNKKVGVYGLGETGMATANALVASGAHVFTWDENPEVRGKTANTEYLAEHPKLWPWKELSSIVLSSGISLTHPKPHPIVRKAKIEDIEVIGDIELFARAMNALEPVERPMLVAITGSNGKSTTTALIGHILRENGCDVHVGANPGAPVLELPAPARNSVYVLKLSSLQLDLTRTFHADIAVFLNLAMVHIDRHDSFDGYVRSMKRIFLNQTSDDTAIIGVDDMNMQDICTALMAEERIRVVPFSALSALGRGVFALSGRLFYNLDGKTTFAGDISDVSSLRGLHNQQNAAAALAASGLLSVSPAAAVRAAERFEALNHRMEEVGRIGNVTFINDSSASNTDATAMALHSYTDVFWIAGGKVQAVDVSKLRGAVDSVRRAYLIGEAPSLFADQRGDAVDCVSEGDLAMAVARAFKDAQASKAESPVVLLSPACAPDDQFKNFEERGDFFRRIVRGLANAVGEAA